MGKGKPKKKPHQSQTKENSKPGDTRPRDNETPIHVITDRNQVDVDVDGKGVNEVADENHMKSNESKKYSRRKIESNWSRYDEVKVDKLLLVEDYDETKDFDYIRQNSASASSLFKFKEEREWEREFEINNSDNVFGLNLAFLAASLQKYALGEKLGLRDLIQDECKYCITDIIECTSKPDLSSFPQEAIGYSEKMIWSYDGINNYKHLIGLTPENEVQTYKKLDKESSLGIETQVVAKDETDIVKNISNKNIPGKSMDLHHSIDTRSDCDILDELLINNISFNDSNKWLEECGNNENEFIKEDDDNEMKNQLPYKTLYKENEELPIFQNDGPTFGNKMSDGELDLDILLECDLLPSDCENKDGEVDADLDQWLDDMLI